MSFSWLHKTKYGDKLKLHWIDTGSFIVYLKPKDIYFDTAKYIQRRFDNSNYKLERPLPKGKNKQVSE